MRFCFSVFLGNSFLMILLLLIATTSLADKAEEKKASDTLKDDDGQSNDATSVVQDLKDGKRNIFAVGPVNSQMTLFVSGPGGKSDLAGGCTVQVNENQDGIFKITKKPEKMPSGVTGSGVVFVCVDSSGSKLVTMSTSSVSAVNLPDGGSVPIKIDSKYLEFCYDDGSIHLPSSKALHYYTVSSNGEVNEFKFNNKSITFSSRCHPENLEPLGVLCTSGDHISVAPVCKGSTISGLLSGYVGGTNAYLFDGDNTVYVFSAAVFTGSSDTLKKVTKQDAWKSSTSPVPPNPDHHHSNSDEVSKSTLYWIIGITAFLMICAYVAAGLIFLYVKKKRADDAEKRRKDKESGKPDSKGQKDSKESKHKSSKKADGSGGSSRRGGKSSTSRPHSKSKQKKKSSKGGPSPSTQQSSRPSRSSRQILGRPSLPKTGHNVKLSDSSHTSKTAGGSRSRSGKPSSHQQQQHHHHRHHHHHHHHHQHMSKPGPHLQVVELPPQSPAPAPAPTSNTPPPKEQLPEEQPPKEEEEPQFPWYKGLKVVEVKDMPPEVQKMDTFEKVGVGYLPYPDEPLPPRHNSGSVPKRKAIFKSHAIKRN